MDLSRLMARTVAPDLPLGHVWLVYAGSRAEPHWSREDALRRASQLRQRGRSVLVVGAWATTGADGLPLVGWTVVAAHLRTASARPHDDRRTPSLATTHADRLLSHHLQPN